ncbi:MAG: hypothetical protein NC211_03665 [Alistipes senegalensis]|nr:hypothetical protein [Oxalobacter formigenes]MCM1280916.1 hypothetical protein [Alistipes senegalensis]
MLEPVKVAFGQFMGRFFASVVSTTKPLNSFVSRPLSQAIVFAPARMVDAAEEMLNKWMQTDVHPAPTTPHNLPVIICAIAKDYTPTGRDYTRQVADRQMVMIPGDEKERLFGLRTAAGDVRAQCVIFATDEPSARSLAAQFALYLDETMNRRFKAVFRFAGIDTEWPVQIESPDSPAMSIASEAKNLTILAIDVPLKVEIPFFDAPKHGEPNDGKGIPGTDDPAGYPVVVDIPIESSEAKP